MSIASHQIRAAACHAINERRAERAELEETYGQVWDTQEAMRDFQFFGFLAPYVDVKKRDTGQNGTLMFQHHPRYYFSWKQSE